MLSLRVDQTPTPQDNGRRPRSTSTLPEGQPKAFVLAPEFWACGTHRGDILEKPDEVLLDIPNIHWSLISGGLQRANGSVRETAADGQRLHAGQPLPAPPGCGM